MLLDDSDGIIAGHGSTLGSGVAGFGIERAVAQFQFALDVEEERLRYIDRVVEATKPAVAKLAEQSTAVVQKLTALDDQLPAMVTQVHLEEAQAVAAEFLAHAEHARSASGRLQALRAIMVDNKQFKLLDAAPRPDGIALLPSHDQVRFERFQWDRYGAMLSVNPRVTFEETVVFSGNFASKFSLEVPQPLANKPVSAWRYKAPNENWEISPVVSVIFGGERSDKFQNGSAQFAGNPQLALIWAIALRHRR